MALVYNFMYEIKFHFIPHDVASGKKMFNAAEYYSVNRWHTVK